MSFDLSRPSPFGDPLGSARLRQSPEDFRVTEIGSVTPTGAGEHLWLRVRKTGENTDWVARSLAKLAGVKARDVSYAGLKDRWAVTEQWFSVHLPGKADPDWTALNSDSISVLESVRHDRKLRRGVLKGNAFDLVLRALDADLQSVMERFQRLSEKGWPNYFGDQRFGRQASNLQLAGDLITGKARKLPRHQRSLAISAARSYLFNRVLAARVAQGDWDLAITGDVFQLDGRSALFPDDGQDSSIAQRLKDFEIHPTAPLWGRGQPMQQGDCAALEARVLADYRDWQDGLERLGAQLDRRTTRVRADDMAIEAIEPDSLRLQFTLPAGSYATVLIEQLLNVTESPPEHRPRT